MRGYYTRCQEFRSDIGEDAWSIIWKRDNPRCERCGGFIDLEYFVETAHRRKNNPKKHNSTRKPVSSDCCVLYNKSGFSRNESERKKRKRREGSIKRNRCVRKKRQKIMP